MISNNISNTETVRNVFIIDDKGVVRLILVYPMNVGRCIPEILRVLQALQISDKYSSSIPANWTLGDPLIVSPSKTFDELMESNDIILKDRSGISWYLRFNSMSNENIE